MNTSINKSKLISFKGSIKTGIAQILYNVNIVELSFVVTYRYLPEDSSRIILAITEIELLDENGVDNSFRVFDSKYLEDMIVNHKDFEEIIELGYQTYLEEVKQYKQEIMYVNGK